MHELRLVRYQEGEEGEAMGVHCRRPQAGSDPGGAGFLRSSGLQSACEVQVSAQATGWIVWKGDGEERDINNDKR